MIILQAIPKNNHYFPCRDERDIISVSQAISLKLVVPLPVFMYVHSCAHERVYICVCVCVRVCEIERTYMHMCARTHVRMYMYVCVYIHVYICMYIYIFMYFTPLVSPMCVRVRLSSRARTYICTHTPAHIRTYARMYRHIHVCYSSSDLDFGWHRGHENQIESSTGIWRLYLLNMNKNLLNSLGGIFGQKTHK